MSAGYFRSGKAFPGRACRVAPFAFLCLFRNGRVFGFRNPAFTGGIRNSADAIAPGNHTMGKTIPLRTVSTDGDRISDYCRPADDRTSLNCVRRRIFDKRSPGNPIVSCPKAVQVQQLCGSQQELMPRTQRTAPSERMNRQFPMWVFEEPDAARHESMID